MMLIIRKYVVYLSKLFNFQFVRFLLTGILNTVFGYSVFVLFIFIGFHYWLAGLLSTIYGILFNFKTISMLVFNSCDNSLLIRFVGMYTGIYFINLGFMCVLEVLGFDAYMSAAILLAPTALLSYILNKTWVFGVKK